MREIEEIIIHCSDSSFGDAELIDRWHKEKGWSGIGYHYVIGNCYPRGKDYSLMKPIFSHDGLLEPGRNIEVIGAHCRGHNQSSIGICLIGKRAFTRSQFSTLKELIWRLNSSHPDVKIKGHYEFYSGKSCPNINMNYLRNALIKERTL